MTKVKKLRAIFFMDKPKGNGMEANLKDRYTCPFDSPQDTIPRPLGDLELHMGLKSDNQHAAWRIKHKLPSEISLRDVHKWRIRIRIGITLDLNIFNPQKLCPTPRTTVAKYWKAYHAANSANLTPRALRLLQDIKTFLEEHKQYKLREGHSLEKHVVAVTTSSYFFCPWVGGQECPCYRMRERGICKRKLIVRVEGLDSGGKS